MKVEIISRKLIKPLTPTPKSLKNLNLSIIDKSDAALDFAVVLFYESKPGCMSELEESLEKVLVDFYPLAGRYTINDPTVDCSDQGAVFVEAQALDAAELTMETETISHLLPDRNFPFDAPKPLLSIQVTHSPSRGLLAIAVVVSHAVVDGFSLGTFMTAWSKATMNPDTKIEITPSFDFPSLLPYKDHDYTYPESDPDENIVVKRLVFNRQDITRLRSNLSSNQDGKTISRVRIVCAVIAKALRSETRDLVISQTINMRGRTNTPLQNPKHACGNLAVVSLTRRIAAAEATEMGLQELVDLIGDSIEKGIADYADILSPNQEGRDIIVNTFQNLLSQLSTPETNVISFTDWSKFGFYHVDFGFGKPVWTSARMKLPHMSTIVLMSNKEGDGIEAWLHLHKNDMPFFEQDEDIISHHLQPRFELWLKCV